MQPEHETIITKMESGKSFFAFLDKNNKLYGCGNNQPAIFKNLPGIV
jgi:alpha-tubulin suppressor-like RCC1 family protein